ncbi:MAG: helix-turn-helix domain-containing protein [Vicinamibacterales bacterium]
MASRRRSTCPVSRVLDVLGDRWSLLVVRDLVRGKRRFSEFAGSPEGIPTNILAERLRRLRARGIVRTRRYTSAPPRLEYVLTDKGAALRPVLAAMAEWGVRHAGGVMPPLPPPPAAGRRTARATSAVR